MTRPRTEHRHIGGKRIRVERRTIASKTRAVAGVAAAVPQPERIGPTAVDCGHLLRHRPARFPADFFPTLMGRG